jgi:hypothetical protein
MKTTNKKFALVTTSLLAAVLLSACGGGGDSPATALANVPASSIFSQTSVDAVTALLQVTNSTSVTLADVQVIVSALEDVSTFDDGSSPTKEKGLVLYNSNEDATATQSIASGANFTFSLKSVSFAFASSDTATSATAVTCSGTTDTALGSVQVEVFNEGYQIKSLTVNVCALQGLTYNLSVSN